LLRKPESHEIKLQFCLIYIRYFLELILSFGELAFLNQPKRGFRDEIKKGKSDNVKA
jgi:hypothetical protein